MQTKFFKMKKITGYLSKNENIFVYFKAPSRALGCIGAFLNKDGNLLSIVNPFHTEFFVSTWVIDADKKEIEVPESFEDSLWVRLSYGQYSKKNETSTDNFVVFMIEQKEQNLLEILTYKTSTDWNSYVGYVLDKIPPLISKTVNGEPVKLRKES